MPIEEPETIDTSKMSAGQRAAIELTEAARDCAGPKNVCRRFVYGRVPFGRDFTVSIAKRRRPRPRRRVPQKLESLLRDGVDADEIDRTGEIPQAVIDGLAKLGAFGIKIPTEYGGLGLSQTNYCRAGMLLGSYCGNLTALISAHQSIGVPQPLILFGTEEQKKKYLPRVARGEISAFALTEPKVGSDPATMETHAEPTPDGTHLSSTAKNSGAPMA